MVDTAYLVSALTSFYSENQYFCWAMLPILVIWLKAFITYLKATFKVALMMLTMLVITAGAVYATVNAMGL